MTLLANLGFYEENVKAILALFILCKAFLKKFF